MNRPIFEYIVIHPEYGSATVTGEDRLEAVQDAAKTWGKPWTSIARECRVERGREIKNKLLRKKVKSIHRARRKA